MSMKSHNDYVRINAVLVETLKTAVRPLALGVKYDVNKHTNIINAKLVLDILKRIDRNNEDMIFWKL